MRSLDQLGTANQTLLHFFGAIVADFSTPKTKPIPSFQTWKCLVSPPQVPQVMTLFELVANILIGVDTCAISTDALTIHPL